MKAIQQIARWEAHKGSISALQWMQHGKIPGSGFVTSASADRGLTLWSPLGAHVGNFGQQQPWDFEDTATWSSTACSAVEATQLQAIPNAGAPAMQQPSRMFDTAVDALLSAESSELSDDGSVYSSGDEVLPECFKEPLGSQ